MELKHDNSNNENVVASNLNQMNILFFLNCKYQVWKQTSYVILFFETCLTYLQNKTPHNFYFTHCNTVNQSLLYKYESIMCETIF